MPIIILFLKFVHAWFKSQRNLALENMALKQQVAMLRRSVKRPRVSMADKLFWISFSKFKLDWRNVLHCMPCTRIQLFAGIEQAFADIGIGRAGDPNQADRPLIARCAG